MEQIAPEALGFGRLFSTIRDAVIVGDPSTGRIVLWNEAAEGIFGYSAVEAIGSPMEMLVPDSLKELHRIGLRRYTETGHGPLIDSGEIVELPAIRKDGTEIVVELTLTPIEGEKVPGRFALAVVRDVTERKRYSEALERANIELQAVNQAMRDFVAVASHDLRSPITSILGFATTLNKSWADTLDEDKLKYLGIIERQTHQLSRLVDDLLTISEVEAGAININKIETRVDDAIERAIEFYSHLADIEVSIAPGLTVIADADHVHRIIANLVGNATRYGRPPVRITAGPANGSAEIRVSDSGQGVPDEFVPRLFEKFARADTEATRREKGSGLGLSIVRGLAEANEGEVWYEHAQPHGACFGVRFARGSDVTTSDAPQTSEEIKVLAVIEDDPDVRELIRLNLSQDRRIQILGEVASAEEAITLAQGAGTALGLIVLDHSLMGHLTGLEAAPLLKEVAPNAKIILFTAHEHLRVEAMASPSIDAFLLKTRADELLRLCQRLSGLSET